MRLLHLIADGNAGGGTTHVQHVLRHLGKTFTCGLVTQAGSYLLGEVQELGLAGFGVDFFSRYRSPLIPWRIRQIVARFQPHVLHVHGGRAGLWSALAATGLPMIYTVHGFHFPHKGQLMRWLGSAAERYSIGHAARTIFVSHYDVQLARAYRLLPAMQTASVIYNGIELRKPFPTRLDSGRHIGFLGRLEYQKDPCLFVEVMAHLPDYTATIVGGGALQDEVVSAIARYGLRDRVRLTGPLSHAETLQVLAHLSAVVMTSRWEGLPLVPLEAMWAGVPVVALEVGGLSEIIASGKSGLLVRQRSASELAAAIRQVTQDQPLRQELIQHARDRVQSLFSVERMVAALEQVYVEVASGTGG